jgi:hypothetical protein
MPRLWIHLAGFMLLAVFSRTGAALEEGEEYEPPPEGYEEKYYSIRSLTADSTDFPAAGSKIQSTGGTATNAEDVMAILRYCVEPESWTRRGPARMEQRGGALAILQKKEVHAEIAKVLQWLHEGVKTPFRTTVVVAGLKPETLAKVRAAGVPLTAAELNKALEEAGPDAPVDISEVRGTEGQTVEASSQVRRTYIADYDVSGAVYDPVMRASGSGLLAQVSALRTPDCASLMLKLSVSLSGAPEITKATLELNTATITDTGAPTTVKLDDPKPEKKDEKKDERKITVEVHEAGKSGPLSIRGNLEIELPAQLQGKLATSLVVPRNVFVLAGVLDFSLVAGKPDRRAVFVKASAGPEGVPTLVGVSGLKEGESFRIYPLSLGLIDTPDFPGPDLQLTNTDMAGGGVANAFSAPNPAAAALSVQSAQVRNVQKLFTEKVRKNKVVDPHGPVIFTRLNNTDHALFLKNIKEEQRNHLTPLRVRAVALAVTPETQRKLAVEGAESYDPAAVEALATANGAQVLQDSELSVLPLARSHVFAGMERAYIYDYEISGDSYDPVIRQALERGGMLDVVVTPRAGEPRAEITTRYYTVPGAADIAHNTLNTFGVNSGANSSIVLGLKGTLDLIKSGVVAVRTTGSMPYGKFALLGSSKMPAVDGKPETRQVLLFVKVDEGK